MKNKETDSFTVWEVWSKKQKMSISRKRKEIRNSNKVERYLLKKKRKTKKNASKIKEIRKITIRGKRTTKISKKFKNVGWKKKNSRRAKWVF